MISCTFLLSQHTAVQSGTIPTRVLLLYYSTPFTIFSPLLPELRRFISQSARHSPKSPSLVRFVMPSIRTYPAKDMDSVDTADHWCLMSAESKSRARPNEHNTTRREDDAAEPTASLASLTYRSYKTTQLKKHNNQPLSLNFKHFLLLILLLTYSARSGP
jgi:hypothetical protein